jgi:predicted PurR-regulated permease PerM
VDNLLRAVLMGKDILRIHLLSFLSTLGSSGGFGFSGFVLGPVVGAFFWPPGSSCGPLLERAE